MKIVSEASVTRRPESTGVTAPHDASQWLAQLERAWLAGRNSVGQHQASGSANDRPVEQDHANELASPRSATRPLSAAAPGALAPATVGVMGLDSQTFASIAPRQPALLADSAAGSIAGAATPAAIDSVRVASHGDAGTAPTSQAPIDGLLCAAQAIVPDRVGLGVQSHVIAETMSPNSASVDELPSDCEARQPAAPSQAQLMPRTLLQVSLARESAQITLRDASLSPSDAARAGPTIAAELLGLGLRAVRVYVNGIESHYGTSRRAQESAHPRQALPANSETTSPAPSTLERT